MPIQPFNAMSIFPTLLQLAEQRRQEEREAPMRELERKLREAQLEREQYAARPKVRGLAYNTDLQALLSKEQEYNKTQQDMADEAAFGKAVGTTQRLEGIAPENWQNQMEAEVPSTEGGMMVPFDKSATQARANQLRELMSARETMAKQPGRLEKLLGQTGSQRFLNMGEYEQPNVSGEKKTSPEYKLLEDIYGEDAVQAMTPEERITNLSKIKQQVEESKTAGKYAGTPIDPTKGMTADQRLVYKSLSETLKRAPTAEELQTAVDARVNNKMERMDALMRSRQAEQEVRRRETLTQYANARAEAMAKWGLNAAYDEESGQFIFATKADLKKNKSLVPANQAEKSIAKQAIYGEIKTSIQNVRDSLDKMPDEFDFQDMVQIGRVLQAQTATEAQGVWGSMVSSAWMKSLSEEKQNYVISLVNAYESLLALRSIQGVGQGSESTRAAMRAMAPSGLTPSKEYAQKQLDRVEAELEALGKGIVPVKPPSESTYKPTTGRKIKPIGGFERRKTKDGRILEKLPDGTIREVK